jgi:hypothetical protein
MQVTNASNACKLYHCCAIQVVCERISSLYISRLKERKKSRVAQPDIDRRDRRDRFEVAIRGRDFSGATTLRNNNHRHPGLAWPHVNIALSASRSDLLPSECSLRLSRGSFTPLACIELACIDRDCRSLETRRRLS